MPTADTSQDQAPLDPFSGPSNGGMGRRAYDRQDYSMSDRPAVLGRSSRNWPNDQNQVARQSDERHEDRSGGRNADDHDRSDDDGNNHGDDNSNNDGNDHKNKDDGAGVKPDQKKQPTKSVLREHPLLLAAACVLLIVLIVGAIAYWRHARQYEATDDAYIDGHMVRLAPQVAGTVQQILIDDNQSVTQNQLLAVIDTSQQRARYEGLTAQATQARSAAAQTTSQVEVSRQQVSAARAKLGEPQAALVKARADLARLRGLQKLEPSAVAGQQIDAANEALQRAQAQRESAAREVDQTLAQLKAARTAIDTSQAAIKAADAQVRASNVDLTNSRITAPVAGRIANRNVALGSYVEPGQQIMAIVPSKLWVTANFKETQLTLLRVGQSVDLKVDAFPDVAFTGHVESLQPGAGQAFALLPAENATGNFVKVVQRVPVRISVDAPGFAAYPIGPGMSVVPSVKVR